jgi:uncharacterized protein (DUF362 family)
VPRAVVVTGDDKLALLEGAIEDAGLWESLAAAVSRTGSDPGALAILVKPDLTLFDLAVPTFTDPELVERLIDLLYDRGYPRVAVAVGRSATALWLENREPLVLADLAGYRFVTGSGRPYDILDLGEDLAAAPAPPGSVLCGRQLARAWIDAQFRIGFAKCKTDDEELFALGAHNLFDVLPLSEADRGSGRFTAPDLCTDLLRATPLHFAIIDAFISNHGCAGARSARPLATRTLIASPDPLLCDWAAALKMGLDPFASPTNAKALHALGLPQTYAIAGDLATYPGWVPADAYLAESVRRRNASPWLARAVEPWLQPVDRDLFPFKSVVDDRVNAALARLLCRLEPGSPALAAAIGFDALLAAAREGVEAAEILFAKDRLHWRERPLGLDLSLYGPADYAAVESYMEPLERLIRAFPADAAGLRWRYLDGSVLFELARELPVPFDAFVQRVDVSRAIRYMNDYIGGDCVPVCRDAEGRAVHQAERNLYLPQPNYLVLSGGQPIDVTKLESVAYGADEHKICWRTVKSENGSAVHDDGSVTFSRRPGGGTRVEVVGLQKFTLPLFWQAANLERYPAVKNALVEHAYAEFFNRTLANFEAAYEGRDFRIGHPPAEEGARPVERAAEVLERLVGWLAGARVRLRQALGREPAPTGHRDADGFRHFTAGGKSADSPGPGVAAALGVGGKLREASVDAIALFLELGDAMRRDVAGLPENEETRR